MKNPIKQMIRQGKDVLNGVGQLWAQRKHQVRFYNVWTGQTHDEMYWYRFLNAKGLLKAGKTFAFFSCFGRRNLIDYVHSDVKIFISGENLKRNNFAAFADHYLGKSDLDLALGLEVFDHPRYIRFPIWMDYMFPPEFTEEDIRAKCKVLRYPNIAKKEKFCCMVASNEADGLRDNLFRELSRIARVDSAGKHLHNDNSLVEEFGDNKIEYMKQYMFNICPENTCAYGYTTEKLFEAIYAGCIPVYWGAEFADKEVINEEAIILWNRKDNGADAVKKIKELYNNPKLLQDFLLQPRLKQGAEEYILETYKKIEMKFRELVG